MLAVLIICGASAQITLKAVADEVSQLVLDTRELDIQQVSAEDGTQLQHSFGQSSEVQWMQRPVSAERTQLPCA